jgi:heme/copper-type cytochrome/quinol oxidase subunit 4
VIARNVESVKSAAHVNKDNANKVKVKDSANKARVKVNKVAIGKIAAVVITTVAVADAMVAVVMKAHKVKIVSKLVKREATSQLVQSQ